MFHLSRMLAVLAAMWAMSLQGGTARGDETSPPANDKTSAHVQTLDEKLLFFPRKFPAGEWQPDGLRFKEVFFTAEDKTRLNGWFCPCDHPRAVVLFAHGNGGNISYLAPWLKYLQNTLRVTTFVFDYRGYGKSEGVPTVEGALQDARAARAKLCELAGVKDSQMLLIGESLGGAIAVQLAAESPPRGLVLQSTFSSLRDIADVHYPKLSWMVPHTKLESMTALARYHGPLLQSHGEEDRTIPFSLGAKLYMCAGGHATFVRIPGAGHNNWFTRAYAARLDEFIGGLGAQRDSR